ncbi:MAG: peptidyl-tRNA hydrolase Pth2 [Candidatus Micrarchaeota archaeon]
MYKQTIVVRTDLNMGRGKIAAQASHASLAAYEKTKKNDAEAAADWERMGMKKVVLKVQSEDELLEYYNKGKDAGIPVALIRDAGHTQVESGSITCFGAGPWNEEELDKIYGKLKLL